jgi:hypothetical protein
MQTTLQRAILAVGLALGAGCGGAQGTTPGGVGATPMAGKAAPIGASGTGSAVAGTTSLSAGTSATAGRASGSSGTGAISGVSGTGSIGTAGVAASTAGGSAIAAGTGAAGATSGTAGSAAGSGGAVGTTSTSPFPQLPRVTTTDGPGPFKEVVKVKNTPPGGWMIYPKDIGMGGMKHPLFIFGPGGGTTPDTYEQMGMHWDRYGSYGFVIYVLPMSTGDGAPMKAGLDWLIKQNDDMTSPLYQHLDVSKVCAAGHSQGSVTTFAFMPDDRVTTTVHISGGSFDGMGPSHLTKDTMFLCGEMGDPAAPQCATDFTNSKVPTFYTVVKGSSHLTSGRLGWEAIIAWLLWHLADQEDQWKKEFIEPTGKFQMGIYQSKVKGW